MQDLIQKLWSDSVEVEGIAASMVLRKTDIKYISSSLSILKSKIAELDSLVNSIQLDDNDADECSQPVSTPVNNQPPYREILKETIFIESSHDENVECPVEEPQPAIEIPTPVQVEHQLVEETETTDQPETEPQLPVESIPETTAQPLPEIVRPVLDSSIVDEDIREEQTNNHISKIAIEPDPDTEPAVEPEPEFDPVLDPAPEPEAEQEIEQEISHSTQAEQVSETVSIDQAVETEEKLEESIAPQIKEVEHPEPAQPEETKAEVEPITEPEQHQTEARPIADEIQPELPEGEPEPTETPIQDKTGNELESPISLDQKLSRKISKNFRQAISLNDKFRFRRELFGNSSQQYDAALDLIAEMSSFDEARDYFLDNYGWDAENDDVKSFFEILSNHFDD